MNTQLQRRGVSETVEGQLPNGAYLEIGYHHGGKYFYCETTITSKKPNRIGALPTYANRYEKLKASDIAGAIEETAKLLKCSFDSEIKAYCYSDARSLQIWPHIASDVYITCATYEPYSDTIRHEPTNYCLVTFSENGITAKQYPHEAMNRQYSKQIQDGLSCYNSNVAAHGAGIERKEWLAWLIGQYIKDLDGEKPVRLQSINRDNNKRKKVA